VKIVANGLKLVEIDWSEYFFN